MPRLRTGLKGPPRSTAELRGQRVPETWESKKESEESPNRQREGAVSQPTTEGSQGVPQLSGGCEGEFLSFIGVGGVPPDSSRDMFLTLVMPDPKTVIQETPCVRGRRFWVSPHPTPGLLAMQH